MLNKQIDMKENECSEKGFMKLPENPEINEAIDMGNIMDLIKNKQNSNETYLSKTKGIINLMMNNELFEYILSKCFEKSSGGDRIRTGFYDFADFRITSIYSDTNENGKIALIFKYFPTFGYIQNIPGTLRSFTLKRIKINEITCKNSVEIYFLGNFGKEFSVKINFFTYN